MQVLIETPRPPVRGLRMIPLLPGQEIRVGGRGIGREPLGVFGKWRGSCSKHGRVQPGVELDPALMAFLNPQAMGPFVEIGLLHVFGCGFSSDLYKRL